MIGLLVIESWQVHGEPMIKRMSSLETRGTIIHSLWLYVGCHCLGEPQDTMMVVFWLLIDKSMKYIIRSPIISRCGAFPT